MKRNILPFAAALVAIAPVAFADGKACDLTSPEEIQGTLGVKTIKLEGSTLPTGVDVCAGKAAGSTFTLRLYAKPDDAERDKEVDRLDTLQKQGATINTKKVGSISCIEIGPGGKATRQAYTTTCTTASTKRAPRYVVVEVANPSQSFEVKKLAPLAENIGARLY
jgi:hypothetical protein